MFYFLYKTINKINGMFYVGVHRSETLNDNYLGSGTRLKLAVKKYGYENFKMEIIGMFNNEKDMFSEEAKIVNDEFIKRKDTYNIVKGGYGGFQCPIGSEKYKKWRKNLLKKKSVHKKRNGGKREFTEAHKRAISLACKGKKGRVVSAEERAKTSLKMKLKKKTDSHKMKISKSIIEWHRKRGAYD